MAKGSPILLLLITAVVFLGIWGVSGWVVGSTPLYPMLATLSFVLFSVATIPIFTLLGKLKIRPQLLIPTYFATWLIVLPAVWLVVYVGSIYFNAWMINTCCNSSELMQIDYWIGINELIDSPVTSTLFSLALIFLSLSLSKNIQAGSKLVWFPRVGVVIGSLFSLLEAVFSFYEI